jgi:nucleoside-diphosphate-sugar epimerase
VLAGTAPSAVGQAFNIGSMVETTVAEALGLVAELTGFGEPSVQVDTALKLGAAYEDLPRRVPDNTKARTVLGWNCETSLKEGLVRTIDWARANPWWLALADDGA